MLAKYQRFTNWGWLLRGHLYSLRLGIWEYKCPPIQRNRPTTSPTFESKMREKVHFFKRNARLSYPKCQNQQFCDLLFSLNLAQENEWKENFFLQNIDFFYFHYFSILIPLCITTSPSPSLNTLPNIHVLWTDHVNLSSSHFNDRESYVSSCVLTSPIGG